MAKKQNAYDALRSYSSSGGGRSSRGSDGYAALASFRSPKETSEERTQREKAERQKKLEEDNKKAQTSDKKPFNLASLATEYAQGVGSVFETLFSGTRKVGQSVDALTGGYDQRNKILDEAEESGKVSREVAEKIRQKQSEDLAWVGTKTDTGENLKKAAGVTLEAGSEVAPIPIGRAAQGASLVAKLAKAAAGGAAASGVGSAGSQLALEGDVSLPKTLADMAVGGTLGTAASALPGALKALRGKTDKLIKPVHAAEDVIRTESMNSAGQKIAKAKEIPAKVNKQLLDKNAPVKQLKTTVEEITGSKIAKDKDPYELLKLRAGVEGQVVTHLNDTASWMKGIPKDLRQDGDAYGWAKQYLSRPDVYGEDVLKTAQNTIQKLEQKYGGNIVVLDDYTSKTRQTFDSLVDIAEQNGLISKDRAAEFRANPDYFGKMEVLQDDLEKFFPGQGSSINVRKTPFNKLKGQKKGETLAPAAESYVNQTTRIFETAARNKVGKAVGGLADQIEPKDGIAFRPKDGNRTFAENELPKDYTRISYMENGEKFEVAVPKEVGDILTGADVQQFDVITGMMGKVNNVFRQAVTTYNPLFTFWRNPQRDFKAFLTNARYVPVRKAVGDYSSALIDAMTNGKWTSEFLRAGGGQAGYLAREGGQAGKSIAKTAKEVTGKENPAWKVVKSPLDLYKHMAQAFEQAPRVAEFKGALKAGKSAEEAAIAGREVTVDFAQGGKLAKLANQWIPFLNARAQGTRRLATAFKENPKRALTVYAATTALPMAGLMAWNNQFREAWDSVPDYEKENNFLIFLSDKKDASGRYTDVIRIPKGDVDKILGNTLETMLDQFTKEGGDFGDALGRTAVATASNISPISFANEGQFSPSQIASSTLPALVKSPLQVMTNRDFFKDQQIVPENLEGAPVNEQVKSNTPGLARAIGQALGVSPLQVENVMNTFFGQIPTDISSGGGSLADRSVRGVVGASGNKTEQAFFDVYGPAKKTKEYREKQFYKLVEEGKYGEAQRRVDEYNRDIDERFKGYFKQYGATLPEEIFPGTTPYDLIDSLKMDVVVSKKGRPYINR